MPDPKTDQRAATEAISDNAYEWLAHELHDGLLPWVVSAKMHVESSLVRLADGDSATREVLSHALRSLKNAMREGRSLMNYLVEGTPSSQENLSTLLQRYVHEVSVDANLNGQRLLFQGPQVDLPPLDKPRAWATLRWVQQAITNAIQHAGPTDIRLSLSVSPPSTLELIVEDQGIGFDASQVHLQGHYGLQSLQLRARQSGGTCTIESQPGNGCRLRLLIPIVDSK